MWGRSGLGGTWVGLGILAGLLHGCGSDGTGPNDVPHDEPGRRPQVVSLSPEPGAEGASVVGAVSVVFDQSVDSTTLAGALTVSTGERQVAGTVRLEGPSTVVFTPSWALDFGVAVTATVGSGLRDTQGDPVKDPPQWTFRTEGAPLPWPSMAALEIHARDLADDSLRGRGSGTADEVRAAHLIALFFEGVGLETLGGVRQQSFAKPSPQDGATVRSQNVLGVVPGRGALADEWVVVGAHYDHVGVHVTSGGTMEIHNGADDNASGTSVVMEMARVYASYVADGGMAERDRRSVLFATWGAEEMGLVGSCAFTDAALVPMTSVTALLNFDMVGRLRDNTAQAMGWESSTAWPVLLAQANRHDLRFESSSMCQSCSDHACFRRKYIPYLWFFTGWHAEYHTPQDDAPLLNVEGMGAIADTGLRVLVRLAVAPVPPPYENVLH